MSRAISVAVLLTVSCVTPMAHAKPACGRGDAAQALTFLHQLQSALRTNNPATVANLVHYPLRANALPQQVRSRAAFLSGYPRIFTPSQRKAVLEVKEDDLFCTSQGYSVGGGVIWFESFFPPGHPEPPTDSPRYWDAGKFGLTAINPITEEAK